MSTLSNYNDAKQELSLALRKASKHVEIAQTIAVDYSLQDIQDLLGEAWSKIYYIQKQYNL